MKETKARDVQAFFERVAEVSDADEYLARVSPLSRAHVKVLGRYSFDLDESLASGVIRPCGTRRRTSSRHSRPTGKASDGRFCSVATRGP